MTQTRRVAHEGLVPAGPFAEARAVADAILYEGYLLYPYRRSSPKNRVRWQFGVLAPHAWVQHAEIPDPGLAGSAESWFQQVETLVEAPDNGSLRLALRFLQFQDKQVYAVDSQGSRPVDSLDTGAGLELSFEEALPREHEVTFSLAELLTREQTSPVELPGEQSATSVLAPDGRTAGVVRRTTFPVLARITVSAERAATPFPVLRLRIRVENEVRLADATVPRDIALRYSMLATHLLCRVDGAFISLLDPPAWAAQAAADCHNRHVFPVLAGADDGSDALLCSPIILYDHPKIAPESPGDLHDAAEIDEILSLRTLTLTDAEKREARATDPRAAAIVDRVDTMPPELLAKLHGAVRDLRPRREAEEELPDHVTVAGVRIGPGSAVRLRPHSRGTDAHDMFLAGRRARVHDILHDVDGSLRLAVTVDDDPAAELQAWYGRFFHFSPDEVTPL